MTDLAWGVATDTGRLREVNQDGVLSSESIFVVADGMGGHHGGEVASAIVVEEMAKASAVDSLDELIKLVDQANAEVLDRAARDPGLRGMGTTMVALATMTTSRGSRLAVANIGDSRLYLRTDDDLMQLTDDHSVVDNMIRDGWITAEEAKVHPQRNVLTRALGIEEPLLVDVWELLAVGGDRYLLCSDGLTNELSDPEIMEILDSSSDPQQAASSLVQAACDAGGRDNVTVVVVDVVEAFADDHLPPADRVIVAHRAALADEVLDADYEVLDADYVVEPDELLEGDGAVDASDTVEQVDAIAEDATNESNNVTRDRSWPASRLVLWVVIAATLLLLLLLVL